MKDQVRHAQKKKAKFDVFNDLNACSAFRLRDFAQKVQPVKFWNT